MWLLSSRGRFTSARRSLVVGVCAGALLVSSPVAVADPGDQKGKVDREIKALRDDLDDTSAELADAYLALRRTEAQLPAARAALRSATERQAVAERRNDELETALRVAQAREASAVEQARGSRASIVEARRQVGRFAAKLYQEQGLGQLTVALGSTSPEDFADRIAMADIAASLQRRTMGQLETSRAAAVADQAHVEALRREVASSKVRAQQALTAATVAEARALEAKRSLDSLAVRQQRQTAAVEARKGGEQRRLRGLQAESDRLASVLAARARAAKAAARARMKREAAARAAASRRRQAVPSPPHPQQPGVARRGGFLTAPSGGYISSEFGMRFHPILRYWRLHAGRDYAAACGQPVVAAAPGVIVSAGWAGDYGNRVVIDHGIQRGVSLATTYNHMVRIARTSGSVARGDVIGYIGTTGASTGCHLHFEVREDGQPVDPRTWL